MKQRFLTLIFSILTLCVFLGCSAQPSAPAVLSENHGQDYKDTDARNDTTDTIAHDSYAIGKLLSLLSLEEGEQTFMKKEFTAFVMDVTLKDSEYVFSTDVIEETGNEDPKEYFYINDNIEIEEYSIAGYDMDNAVLLIDPHNGFSAVTIDSLQKYIAQTEGGVPMRFYSMDETIVMIMEIMLP